jgi:hypothetical protein
MNNLWACWHYLYPLFPPNMPNLSQQAEACFDKVQQWVQPKPWDIGSRWLTQQCYGQEVSAIISHLFLFLFPLF